jgi:hypothetical protein
MTGWTPSGKVNGAGWRTVVPIIVLAKCPDGNRRGAFRAPASAGARAPQDRRTSSCSRPLVASTSGVWIVGVPVQSVNRPPASSTMGLVAATSHGFTPCSTITSAAPSATSTNP